MGLCSHRDKERRQALQRRSGGGKRRRGQATNKVNGRKRLALALTVVLLTSHYAQWVQMVRARSVLASAVFDQTDNVVR